MTKASELAMQGLRDLSTIQWYVIPMLSVVVYIYTLEIKKSKLIGNWDSVLSGLTLFGMDFFNETWNGWIFYLTGISALWTTPGSSALKVMVGWNIEIIFMFAIAGIIFYHSLPENLENKIFGFSEKWLWAISFSAFCVFVEVLLNIGGHLVWEYSFWNRTFEGIWLIFLFGYFHFFVAIIIMLSLKSLKKKLLMICGIYMLAITMNVVTRGILGWNY